MNKTVLVLKSLTLFILLLPTTNSFSKDKESPTIQNPYLYSLEKDGKISYLFGTIHVDVSMVELPSYVVQ